MLLFLIAVTSCTAGVAPTENPLNTIKEGMKAADKALGLYDKILNEIIPWETFDQTIQEFDRHREDYSNESGQLITEIKTIVLKGLNSYSMSTKSINEWCGKAAYSLGLYLKLFKANSATEKRILVDVLDKGIIKMNEAQQHLSKSFEAFNSAAGKLSTLNTQLKNDFDKNSEYYRKQIDKIRTEAYAGAASGAVLGPFGLIIAYSIAAGVIEGKLVPELNAKMDSIKAFYVDLKQTLEKANMDIDTTKTQLQTEIQTIGDLKVETENTQAIIPLDEFETLRDEVIKAVTQLIAHCSDYRQRHGNSKLRRLI